MAIPTFEELLKKIKKPRVSDKFTEEMLPTPSGFKLPPKWKLRKNGDVEELLSPRGLTYKNLKIENGKITDFQAFKGDKPVRFPAVSADVTAPFPGMPDAVKQSLPEPLAMQPLEGQPLKPLQDSKGFIQTMKSAWEMASVTAVEKSKQAFLNILPKLVVPEPVPISERSPEQQRYYQEHPKIRAQVEKEMGISRSIRETTERIAAESQQDYEQWVSQHPELAPNPKYEKGPAEYPELWKDPKWWGYEIASMAPVTLTAISAGALATMLTGGNVLAGAAAAGLTFAPVEMQSVYDDLIEEGVPKQQASELSAIVAVPIVLTESASSFLQFSRFAPQIRSIFRKEATKQIIKLTKRQLLKKGLTTFTTVQFSETMEEVVQEALGNVAVIMAGKDRGLFEGVPEMLPKVTVAMLPFSLIGGGVSTVGVPSGLKAPVSEAVAGAVEEAKARPERGALGGEKVSPEKPVTPEVTKEPWQMTKDEVYEKAKELLTPGAEGKPFTAERITLLNKQVNYHKELVQQAISEGKIIPSEVLKDYPDLVVKPTAIPKEGKIIPKVVKPPIVGARVTPQARLIALDAKAKDLISEMESAFLRQEDELAESLASEIQDIIDEMKPLEAQVRKITGRQGTQNLIAELKELGVWPEEFEPIAEQVKAKPPTPPLEIKPEELPPGPPAPPPPGGITEEPIPEGRPRTLTDLNREAKGMRALSPEERADVMDMAKPIAENELLYKVKPFSEHGDVLLQPDKPINKTLRSIPGVKQATEVLYPAQMERDNPIAMIGIKKRIFEEIETGRARLASLKWWHQAKNEFAFKKVKGKWIATNVELSPSAKPTKPYHATIHDLVEHPENYKFTTEQEKILKSAQDMQNQILRDAQRVGVDAVELSGDYWRRIVTKAPKNALFDGKVKIRIASKKGYTRQRAFDFVDDGATLGFEYETQPLRALQNRLEAGIRTISDQNARQEIAKLPGIVKPLERLESRYPQTLEGVRTARQARDIAKQTFLRNKNVENETALRQSEADYVNSMRELYFKKIAAGQPNIGELKLPNGRIAPVELAEEISKWLDLPEIRTGRGTITNPILAVTQLLRSTLTNIDLAAGFIQGQALFYRNNPAWWVSQVNAVLSLADDRMAYVEKNFEVMDEGMRMGAISVPTEFMFTSQGIASIPTRVPVVGSVMKAFNRAFEWFIVIGQTEMYKTARSGVIRRATKGKQGEIYERQAIEALASLGSAIRKEMGTESYAILGVRPTQHTIEQLTFFAARFFRALVGVQAQSFTGGEGGREARRAMGSLITGGLALLIAASWATEKKLPNMTDPFANDWMQFRIGGTRFSTFGPFFPYFRTIARASVRLAQGEPTEAAKVVSWFLQSKQGLLFRAIDMATQFSMYGSYRTFEGKRLPLTPAGVTEAALGEMAVPISIQEAMTAIPEGRYESVVGEIVGLVGRKVREGASVEARSKLGNVDQEALDAALKDVTNPKKIAEIKAKDWTYDIQSFIRDIRSGTKYLLDQDIDKLEPIVGAYWEFAEQKDEYESLSAKERLQYVKDNNDFLVSRLLYGDDGLSTIPDLKTAESLEALAKKYNIPLDMIPAFQLTNKGKERIPSNRNLWKPYFDYYNLPGSGGYLSYSQNQVDEGKLPQEYRQIWENYQKLKTDFAKTAYRNKYKKLTVNERENFRRANKEFDQWLIEQEYNEPLGKKAVTRRRRASIAKVSVFGGTGSIARPRTAKESYPKFKKPRVSMAKRIRAPNISGV